MNCGEGRGEGPLVPGVGISSLRGWYKLQTGRMRERGLSNLNSDERVEI